MSPIFRFPAGFFVLACVTMLAAGSARAGENKMYDLKKSDEVKVSAGVKAVATLTIASKNGWHVNEEAPMSVTVAPDPGISVEKTKLTRADLADKSKDAPRFDIAFTATEPGKRTINAEAKFVMCQDTACKPVKEKITFAVDAAPTAAAPQKKK